METMIENAVAEVENANVDNGAAVTFDELVKSVWDGDVVLDRKEAVQYIDANGKRLMDEGIVVVDDGCRITFTRHNPVVKSVVSHKYRMPDFADQVRGLVRQSIDGDGMVNLLLNGAAGCIAGNTKIKIRFCYNSRRYFKRITC